MARVVPITLVAPGRRGLNTERRNDLLSPDWCVEATNCVLTRQGRFGARNGWASLTATPIDGSPPIRSLFEYFRADGSTVMIAAAGGGIYRGTGDFSDPDADITPAAAPSSDNWQFVNFNDKVIGFQQGHTPIVYTNTGTFEPIVATSGTVPAGNAAVAAFGRIWALDPEGQLIHYCALLDETKWHPDDGGGTIDLRNVWTLGMDRAIALAAFGANLIVFGRNHIIFYTDDSGSELGVNPRQLYVSDTIEGTGTIGRDTIQPVGEGDMIFVSRHGLQLLGRVLREKTSPTATISKHVRTHFADLLSLQPHDELRSTYSPEHGFYLLLMPTVGRVLVADMRFLFQDEDGQVVAPITEWSYKTMPTSVCTRRNGDLLFGFNGEVGRYGSKLDKNEEFVVRWSSPWLDLDPQVATQLKMLKEIPTVVQISGTADAKWEWEFDWSGDVYYGFTHYSREVSEWGIAEYGVDEYSGGLIVQARTIEGLGEGQFVRVGLETTVDGFDFVLQQIKLLFKLGRMAA